MLPSIVGSEELIEVVYLREVANDPRFGGLDNRLKQLEAGVSASTPPESWVKRNSHWFGLLGPLVAALVFIVGAEFGWFNSIFDGRVATKLNEPNGVNAQLLQLNASVNQANGELSAIRKLWEQQLKKTSELLPREFKDVLPQTANTLKAARVLNIPPPLQFASIQQGLLDTKPTVPGYWAAASEFISYRSSQGAKISPESKLPPCYDVPPAIQGMAGEKPFQLFSRPLEWHECVIDLEEEMPDKWWESIIGTKLYRDLVTQLKANPNALQFTDCLVRYRGGRIPERIYKLLGFATFHGCLLEFDFSRMPPDHGQQLSAALLESPSLKDIRLAPFGE